MSFGHFSWTLVSSPLACSGEDDSCPGTDDFSWISDAALPAGESLDGAPEWDAGKQEVGVGPGANLIEVSKTLASSSIDPASCPQTLAAHVDLIRSLAQILETSSLGEIDYQLADLSVRVARSAPVAPAGAGQSFGGLSAAPITVATTTVCERPGPESSASVGLPGGAPAGTPVKSPLVGTAYMAPQPDHPPFVQVGDAVKAGQTLMIIEAMKVMNTITAPQDGRVAQILAGNGRPVEYDEVLMILT